MTEPLYLRNGLLPCIDYCVPQVNAGLLNQPLFTISGNSMRLPCFNYNMPSVDSILNRMGITNRIKSCCMSIPAPIMYGTAVNVPGMIGIPQIYSNIPNYLNGTYTPLANAMASPWFGQPDPLSLPEVDKIFHPSWADIVPNCGSQFNPSGSQFSVNNGNNPNIFNPQNVSLNDVVPIFLLINQLDNMIEKLDKYDLPSKEQPDVGAHLDTHDDNC